MGDCLTGAACHCEQTVAALPIEGVAFQPLQVMETPAGAVLHGLRGDYPLAPDFRAGWGELYFSEVLRGHVKGWKKHQRQQQLFMVPAGMLRLVLYDDRPASSSRGKILEVMLGRPGNYGLLKIPPLIWHAFAAASEAGALLCNCADMPHDPQEVITLPLDTPDIPYRWSCQQGWH